MLFKKQEHIWYAIFFLAVLGTLGSLYYGYFGDPVSNLASGELFNKENALAPCTLCWYARVLLYPLVIMSAIGIWKKEKTFTEYILPFGILGVILETYHTSIQLFQTSSVLECGTGPSCSEVQVAYFGFISIPMLGLVAFLLITALCVMNRERNKKG